MNTVFYVNHQEQIVQITAQGNATFKDLRELAIKARTKASKLGYHLLYDFSRIVGIISLAEIYVFYRSGLINELMQEAPGSLSLNVAVIANTEHTDIWEFTKTTINVPLKL